MKAVRVVAVACVALAAAACGKKEPIIIGVVGDLRAEDRGGESGFRNGVMMGMEAINDGGGVDGRLLQPLLGNDLGDPGMVARVDDKLVASGAVALIGHNTSATTGAALPVIERHRILLIGPEATSSQFAGKKDFFVRNEVREQEMADALAEYAVQVLKIKSVGAIIDVKNSLFTQTYFSAFQSKMRALGGEAELLYPYEALDTVEAGRQVAAFVSRGGKAVLLATDGPDTRNLVQEVRRVSTDIPLLGSPWAVPPSFNETDPPPPDGLIFPVTFDPDSQTPTAVAFRKDYEKHFGRAPDYHAVHGYEAVMILAQALKKAGAKQEKLPQAVVEIGTFQGLEGPISIDPFGDAKRQVFINQMVGGRPRRVFPQTKG